MKLLRRLLILALGGFAPLGAWASPASVEKWSRFEIELKGPAEGNPFVEVRVGAVFTDGIAAQEIDGFYDGGGIYRVRFMPGRTGEWHFETKSNRPELAGKTGEFSVIAPAKGNHGPVRVQHTFHFAYADGTPYRPIGTTIYNWLDAPEDIQEQTLRTLTAAPFNKARMLLTPQPTAFRKIFPPPRWPFVGTPPHNWDYARFNPEYFRHYEKRIAQLRDLGIEADLILFNPYGKWGFEAMSPAEDERYVRYVIARFAALRNVWWSLANEYDFLRTKTDADWDRLGALVQAVDPYDHLRSIHNGSRLFDQGKAWITHVSMQNGAAADEPGRAELYRDVWRKPVVYDEIGYEGRSPYRWGNLTGEEMVHRFWCGTVAGTYVGHGDYFLVDEDTWTSFGGTLKGTSSPRLAFLRRVIEEGPAQGLDPIDKWQDVNTAGVPGLYYLTYFGREQPTEWKFSLYKNGVRDGQRYKVEIIDTWNMTVSPVAQEFVTRKLDAYHYVDAHDGVVKLPGKSGIALRVQRVDASTAPEQPLRSED